MLLPRRGGGTKGARGRGGEWGEKKYWCHSRSVQRRRNIFRREKRAREQQREQVFRARGETHRQSPGTGRQVQSAVLHLPRWQGGTPVVTPDRKICIIPLPRTQVRVQDKRVLLSSPREENSIIFYPCGLLFSYIVYIATRSREDKLEKRACIKTRGMPPFRFWSIVSPDERENLSTALRHHLFVHFFLLSLHACPRASRVQKCCPFQQWSLYSRLFVFFSSFFPSFLFFLENNLSEIFIPVATLIKAHFLVCVCLIHSQYPEKLYFSMLAQIV